MNSVNITQMNYIPMNNNHNQSYSNNQNPNIQPLLGNLDDSKNFILIYFYK
jgi:hypothetical protein